MAELKFEPRQANYRVHPTNGAHRAVVSGTGNQCQREILAETFEVEDTAHRRKSIFNRISQGVNL